MPKRARIVSKEEEEEEEEITESGDLEIYIYIYIMGWRHKAGLVLIASVVLIWVTSAEVTQEWCRECHIDRLNKRGEV